MYQLRGLLFIAQMTTMIEADTVAKSFGRCLAFDNLLFDKFYDNLLHSDSRIPPMFKNTDMQSQKKLLRAGINYVIMYCTDSGKTAGEIALARIRKSHSKVRMNIPQSLYPLWIASLIKAVEETDPKFSPGVKDAWAKVLNTSVDYIKSGFLEQG